MDKKIVIGIAAGVASLAGIAMGATLVLVAKKKIGKIFEEMQDDVSEKSFTSPDGNNSVKISFGASKIAQGTALVSVIAQSSKATCTFLPLARKCENFLDGEWIDNDQFQLLIGCGRKKQCYNISFDGDKIVANYSLRRIAG